MNKNDKLRSQVIRLAHANPKLRKDLLPLVTTKTASSYNEVMKVLIQILKREDDYGEGITDTSNQSKGKIELEWYGGYQRGWEVFDREDEPDDYQEANEDNALYRKSITKKVNQALAPFKSIIKSYSVDYIEKGRWWVQVQLTANAQNSTPDVPATPHWSKSISYKDFYLAVMKQWHGGKAPGDYGDFSTLIRDSKWKSSGVGPMLDSINRDDDYRGVGGGNVLNAPRTNSNEGPVFSIWFKNVQYSPMILELDDLFFPNMKRMLNQAKSPEEMMAMLKKRPAREFIDGDFGVQGNKSKLLPIMAKKIKKNWKALKVLARSIDPLQKWWINGGNLFNAEFDLRETPNDYEEAKKKMIQWLVTYEKATLGLLKKTVK